MFIALIMHGLGKTLGKGTFGKVKLGTHLITKEKVLIVIDSHLMAFRLQLKYWTSQ